MATLDVELLRRVLERVQYYPNGWDPTRIARRDPVDRDGWRYLVFGVEGHAIESVHDDALWHWLPDPDRDGAEFALLVTVDGSRKKPGRNASFVARKLLGLDVEQAERLFGAATIEELRLVVDRLCAGAS
jgi:hypothetical protein